MDDHKIIAIFCIICMTHVLESNYQQAHLLVENGTEISKNSVFIHIFQAASTIECSLICTRKEKCCVFSFNFVKQDCILDYSGCCPLTIDHSVKGKIMEPYKTNEEIQSQPKDCQDILKRCGSCMSGEYTIFPRRWCKINVFCDMETDGGGWTVMQRRYENTTDFFRGWEAYKTGFGSVSREYWIGNEILHLMTTRKTYQLRIDLQDWSDVHVYAFYQNFQILSETEKYRLSIGNYSGTAGDSLTYHNLQEFSTFDKDHSCKCAQYNLGGWWYICCYRSNLNGLYSIGYTEAANVLAWERFRGYTYSLKRSKMMIRPSSP